MSQGKNNQKSRPIDVIRAVKQSAASHWQLLLPTCGICSGKRQAWRLPDMRRY
ncbi:hypothetical protein SAMN05421579_1487 [Xenorhabdus japonica]|uniref:Uncharacterized protein n=1 Tax=Xenorhabdus japonica TaxID=53341 RepID=A0A1I5DYC3_9GAMM|nr:hypothetical protein SAMN05421579_1487 [Xenorhabdus japonica]